MKKAKKIMATLLGLLLVSVVALVGVILYAEYSGKRFPPAEKDNSSQLGLPEDESRLVYDENGNIAELPGISVPEDADSAQAGDAGATVPDGAGAEAADASQGGEKAADSTADTGDAGSADETGAGADNAAQDSADASQGGEHTYIMNKESSIFHYDTCPDVQNISEENRLSMTSTRDTVMSRGYEPCQNCKP